MNDMPMIRLELEMTRERIGQMLAVRREEMDAAICRALDQCLTTEGIQARVTAEVDRAIGQAIQDYFRDYSQGGRIIKKAVADIANEALANREARYE